MALSRAEGRVVAVQEEEGRVECARWVCVLWGARVIVPPPGREQVVHELHKTHPGIARMKSLARSYVWWPKMDAELEAKV